MREGADGSSGLLANNKIIRAQANILLRPCPNLGAECTGQGQLQRTHCGLSCVWAWEAKQGGLSCSSPAGQEGSHGLGHWLCE